MNSTDAEILSFVSLVCLCYAIGKILETFIGGCEEFMRLEADKRHKSSLRNREEE